MGTNTGIGIGIGIPFRNNALGGDNIYFPPELKARMIGVWDNYGKKNTDADRNIIKNKIPNAGGDLEILNSAYKLNSGFGEYREDFTSWIVSKEPMTVEKTDSQVHISYIGTSYKELPMFEYSGPINENYSLTVEIQGIPNNVIGKFIHNNGFTQEVTNGINTIKFSNSGSWYGFTFYREDNTIIGDCNITIKQIPAFEGALVTDGINDIIASIKTLEDWNIGNKGITIVSMIHQINTNTNNFITTNNIRTDNKVIGRNIVSNIEKTGIYGWYKENIQSDTINVINNILGDKNDYTSHSSPSTNINPINNSKFYVQGYAIENGFAELSSVAHYWTFAVLGKATEDEINLIIAKYNLDRTLRPDILCNITKQGITNDNHADFNDKLVDYSGNGRDIQMYNLAWKGSSGVAAKKFETIKDYLIVPDEGLQELTIYNEFSYKVKSIKHADRYWTIQTLNKTDVSYPITIVSDKNIIWRNAINYTDENGVKRSIRKETNVPANTPTQVFVLGFNDFDVPDNYTKVNCVSYATRTDITEFTVIFIPSCKGGILLDGIEDFGKVTGMPIYKDYTVVADYIRTSAKENNQDSPILSKSQVVNNGAFVFNYLNTNSVLSSYSFGINNRLESISDSERKIYYQSKYVNDGKSINSGTAIDYNSMWLGTYRDNVQIFFNGAIYSLMSFPYSMSKFLIERQLKKHKLGTLYPNMVEFRPVIKANANYNIFYTALLPLTGDIWERINIGDYVPVGRRIAIQMSFDNEASELVSAISSQLGNISITKNSNNKGYTIFGDILKNKSPQKINITIDEYIRYEDIVQPYPVLLRFNDENGNEVSWGGKFRVGSTITRIGSAADSNLLPNIYNIFGLLLNDNQVTSVKVIVEKTMVFKAKSAYIFDNNEPKVILSPSRLRMPNSSYKILGYIPDISGHGNHGVIHNSAYAKGSGVNEDGSYQFDGVDDHVTIPTLSSGGKQVLMKVNWDKTIAYTILYDQRGYPNEFAIYNADVDNNNNPVFAYQAGNNGQTYIDGILNKNIKASELRAITHNITITNELSTGTNTSSLVIGSNRVHDAYFTNMALYDFMLFDSISTDDKIKELNEYIGIEAKVELPPYYWDAYGKTNLDEDKNYTANLGTVKDVIEVSQPAIFAENWYDGNPEPVLSSPIINQTDYSIEVKANKMDNNFTMMLDVECDTPLPAFKAKFSMVGTAISVDLKYYINGGSKIIDVFKSGGSTEPVILDIPASERSFIYGTNTDNYPNILIEILPADNGTSYGLTNTNFAYDKMSGYGGYNLSRFDKSWSSSSNTSIKVVQRNPYDITLKKLGGNSDWEFNNTELKVISNPVSVKFKSNKNIRVTCDYHYYPVGGNSEDTPLGITSKDLIANKDAIITISPISQENIDKYNIDVNRGYYLIYFQLSSTLAVNEEVTIEMLPLYPNGLVYDGVTDYSENANISALTDYTYIFKREFLSKTTGSASMYKGEFFANGGMAFIADYAISDGSLYGFSYRGQAKVNSLNTDKIIYGTKTSVNGSSITPNTNIDTAGLTMGKFDSYRKFVFYKLILYPKTIPLLQINFLKNLMERDEIIDLDNPIFKK